MRFSLNTGKVAEMGDKVYYTLEASAETDSSGEPVYSTLKDLVGLRLSEDGERVEAVSCVGRKVVATAALYPAEWDSVTLDSGETARIAGVQTDNEEISVGVLWGGTDDTTVTVTAAFYDSEGKMVAVRSDSGQSLASGLDLVQMDTSGLPEYETVKVFVTYPDSWVPVCKAQNGE
jgi:hypothetical protein